VRDQKDVLPDSAQYVKSSVLVPSRQEVNETERDLFEESHRPKEGPEDTVMPKKRSHTLQCDQITQESLSSMAVSFQITKVNLIVTRRNGKTL
jgi:hypothetical protein